MHRQTERQKQTDHNNLLLSSSVNKSSTCNNFLVKSDLVHDFMNFNALKIILKIHKEIIKTEY